MSDPIELAEKRLIEAQDEASATSDALASSRTRARRSLVRVGAELDETLAAFLRGPCMAPAPVLGLKHVQFRGPRCFLLAWHRGPHRNRDGAVWSRSLRPLLLAVRLKVLVRIAMARLMALRWTR